MASFRHLIRAIYGIFLYGILSNTNAADPPAAPSAIGLHPTSIFTAISPKLIRENSVYNVFLSLESNGEPTTFIAEIIGLPEPKPFDDEDAVIIQVDDDDDDETNESTTTKTTKPTTTSKPVVLQNYTSDYYTVQPGASTLIPLNITSLHHRLFNLTIKGLGRLTEQHYHQVSTIFRETRTKSILIQSDKPIYKPGETVKYRIVVLNRNLIPIDASEIEQAKYKDMLEVRIKDPHGNIIKILKRQSISNGLFSSKFELSKEPNLGDWKIIATLNARNEKDNENDDDDDNDNDDDGFDYEYDGNSQADSKSTYSFSVDQYVLPKFKVDIKAKPSFVTYNESKFNLEINAMYTYGKKLAGFAQIVITEPYVYYSASQKVRSISKKLPIDGNAFVEFDLMKELVEKMQNAQDKVDRYYNNYDNGYRYQREFNIHVSVTDIETSRISNASATIIMYEHAYKFELINSPQNYKPGFPVTLFVKVSSQDNSPVHDESPDALVVKHGFNCDARDGVLNFSIPENGIVKINLDAPTNELTSTTGLEVTYKGQTQNLYPPQKAFSASKSYIQLSLGSGSDKLYAGGGLSVSVMTNKHFEAMNYVLYGRGDILVQDRLSSQDNSGNSETTLKKINFSITLPPNSAPESTLVVYCILPGTSNEVIADSVKVKLDPVFPNRLSMKFSQGPSVSPGQNVTVNLNTLNNSLIALRGIDASVLLLAKDHDITTEVIGKELEKFQNQWTSYRVWGGSNAFQIFEQAGLVVMTNGRLEKQNWVQPFYGSRHYRRGGGRFMAAGRRMGASTIAFEAEADFAEEAVAAAAPAFEMKMIAGNNNNKFQPEQIRVRTNFPESWLWEEIYTNDSSEVVHPTTVPDTLTTWYITGYSLNPEFGIGLSGQPYPIEVFRPFFITLNVPYSIVKGEIFGLHVLAHNYLNQDVTAEITLNNIDNSIEYNENVNKYRSNSTKSIKIPSNSVSSVIFVITAIKFGTIKLDVRGIVPGTAGDALTQPLIVKPPGRKIIKSKAALIDLKSTNPFNTTLETEFPRSRVHGGIGADEVKISIVGDLLGSTISHLEQLLQLPTGCGEQNLLHFVPDLIILNYLNVTGGLNSDIESKAIRFLESGYQRELTYKHFDGSFSAFGQSDGEGSTWLTAFVIKSFVAAASKHYITIDPKIIIDGLHYLIKKQHVDGSFIELGHVLHSELQGGTNSGNSLALTAYVLLTLVESRNYSSELLAKKSKYDEVIKNGTEYLIKSYDIAKNDSYSISLITYLLTITGHEQAETFFKDLDSLMIKEDDMIYWDTKAKAKIPPPGIGIDERESFFHYYHPYTRPVAVEMSSYALMTYLARNDLVTSLGIAKWLLQQRNSQGGFISTQDTIVGLTALAQFASLTKSIDTDLTIKLKYNGGGGEDDGEVIEENGIQVNKENDIVLQEFVLALPSLSTFGNSSSQTKVEIEAKGKGSALVFLTWSYYVQEKKEKKPSFIIDIKVKASKSISSSMELKICSKYAKGPKSNMVVEEVNLPSGYSFAAEDLPPLVKKIHKLKRFDLEDSGTKLQLYFDYLSSNSSNCIELTASRLFKVSNPAPSYVHVYDYYDTTEASTAQYVAPKFSSCDICTKGVDDCQIQNC